MIYNILGLASRKCLQNGVWSTNINLEKCRKKEFIDLNEMVTY